MRLPSLPARLALSAAPAQPALALLGAAALLAAAASLLAQRALDAQAAGDTAPAGLTRIDPVVATIHDRAVLTALRERPAATSPASPARAASPAQAALFADEFDGAALDRGRWHTCFWWASETCSIESNGELELYRPANVSVAGGVLRLTARREQALAWNGRAYAYTSGMVSTGGRKDERPAGFTFTYGRVEARLRLPQGKGLWPALWLLPASYESRPEVDVLETLGHEPRLARFHVHLPGAIDEGALAPALDPPGGWHVLALDWRPGALAWLVDGVERWRYEGAAVPDEPMYVLVTLAVGGDWPGAPDEATPFPATVEVDWIRVGPPAGQ